MLPCSSGVLVRYGNHVSVLQRICSLAASVDEICLLSHVFWGSYLVVICILHLLDMCSIMARLILLIFINHII